MLEWIVVSHGSAYFSTESGAYWTPVGQNDAVAWPDLLGAYKRKDLPAVIRHFEMMQAHGVNCMRLMLEYCQTDQYYLERPAGTFVLPMVDFWDDIVALCQQFSIRLLLTPFDTFWMWRRWKHHPYHQLNGGPCRRRTEWLSCKSMRGFIKNRLRFITERWGGSGVIFAWDLWNEIQPSYVNHQTELLHDFVDDVGSYLKSIEISMYGKAHLQTLSIFGHQLLENESISGMLFRNPVLDFASTHFYEKGTIDKPKNTIEPAIATGKLVRQALQEIQDNRPFLDTEHGPIAVYKRKKEGLPQAFDEEYFRFMQWAHLASGACGGGMRWPYRQPHVLTPGMRKAQASLANFARLVDWNFAFRKNINDEVSIFPDRFHTFACRDKTKLLLWMLRKKVPGNRRIFPPEISMMQVSICIEGMNPGLYEVIFWKTLEGNIFDIVTLVVLENGQFRYDQVEVRSDLLLYARLLNPT